MTNYFSIDPLMARAQGMGAYAAALSGEAMYIGEHKAAQFIYETNIYIPSTTTSSLVSDPNASLFGQPTTSTNLVDLNSTGSNAATTVAAQSSPTTVTNPDGTTTTTTVGADGTTVTTTTAPDGTTTTTTTPPAGAAQNPGATGGVTGGDATQNPGGLLTPQMSSPGAAQNPGATGGTQMEQYMAMFNQFLQIIMSLIGAMFQNGNVGTEQIQGTEETPEDPAIAGKSKDEVIEERQAAVDKLLESNVIKEEFGDLEKKLASTDAKDLKKALNELKGYDNAKFAAFKQYLEDNNKSLDDILKAAETAKVDSKLIEKIEDKDAEVKDWLEAYDVEETEEAEEAEEAQDPKEIGKSKDEVVEMREEKVEKLTESEVAKRKYEKLEEKLEATDVKDLEKALKELKKLDSANFAAFKQYLEDNGKSLDDILKAAETAGVKEGVIEDVEDKDAKVQDWLEAYDIEDKE